MVTYMPELGSEIYVNLRLRLPKADQPGRREARL